MNHKCEKILTRGSRTGQPCNKIALWFKDVHLCQPHFEWAKKHSHIKLRTKLDQLSKELK